MDTKNTENILEYKVTTLSIDGCIEMIVSWIIRGYHQKYFVCANPHSLVMAKKDDIFKKAIKAADLIVPDGSGIVLASRMLGGHIKNMITGSDIFRKLSHILNKSGKYSYFFLGSTETTLKQINDKLKIDFPNIDIRGTYSPPFKSDFSESETNEMIDLVNKAKADVLWLGLTAPKQEKWIYQNKDKLDVRFIGPIGAVFDFYSENVRRSHPLFLKYGLEWLPRLLQEPRRLWRRTFISAPQFLFSVLKQKWSN